MSRYKNKVTRKVVFVAKFWESGNIVLYYHDNGKNKLCYYKHNTDKKQSFIKKVTMLIPIQVYTVYYKNKHK